MSVENGNTELVMVHLSEGVEEEEEDRAFVWTARELWVLRTKYRLVGRLVGSYAEHSAQNKFNALPLLLMNEELALALELGCVELASGPVASPLPSCPSFRRRACVFADLWRRGFYITSGSKFGAHLMAYPSDPLLCHASHIVLVLAPDQPLGLLDLVSLGRLAVGVKKVAVIASASPDPHGILRPQYISLKWMGVT